MTRVVVLALEPAAREELLGLPGWLRALLAAQYAGLTAAALLVPDEAAAQDARGRLLGDERLSWVGVQVAGAPGDPLADPRAHGPDLLVVNGACVVDREALRALAEGSAAPPPRGLYVQASAPRAEKLDRLLRSLASPADGLVDTWVNRPLSRWFTRALAPAGVSPDAITVASALIGLTGAALLAPGRHDLAVAGALLFQLAAAVDCTDGEVARVTYRFSPIGAKLDLALDNVVHVAIFVAIALAARATLGDAGALVTGTSAVVGALLSWAVVWRLTFHAHLVPAHQRLVGRLANRDFSVLVLLFAALDRLDLLLVLTAIGTHVFWLVLLAVTRRRPAAAA